MSSRKGNAVAGPSSSDNIPILLIPEKIVGVTRETGELEYLMKWRGIDEIGYITAREANIKHPQIVIQFYEGKYSWIDLRNTNGV